MRNRSGFSLVEMMVGLVVLGLLAAFSVPALNSYLSTWNLRSAHNTVISEFKLLRQKSIAEGRDRRIWFSPSSSMYWFQDPETFVWTTYTLPDRVTIESAVFGGSFYDTYMQPNGRSTRAGMIVLRNIKSERDTVMVDLTGWVGRP